MKTTGRNETQRQLNDAFNSKLFVFCYREPCIRFLVAKSFFFFSTELGINSHKTECLLINER